MPVSQTYPFKEVTLIQIKLKKCSSTVTFRAVFLLVCFLLDSNKLYAQPTIYKEEDSQRPLSLTISGGISLGVYEAGLNWTIIELLRQSKTKDNIRKIPFTAVTGTSAGAINAVLSAIRYCQQYSENSENDTTSIFNNTFFNLWNVDFEELLPRRSLSHTFFDLGYGMENIELKDSLLSRSAFNKAIDSIVTNLTTVNFQTGCEIDIGLIVTRVKPLKDTIKLNNVDKEISVHRLVIPLTLKIDENGQARFYNNYHFSKLVKDNENYIHLVEHKEKKSVSTREVILSALASSAFPIAFGRVEISYCIPQHLQPKKMVNRQSCNGNHSMRPAKDYFVDGGIYDNIPLGTAIDLVESRQCDNQAWEGSCSAGQGPGDGQYVYISPSTSRANGRFNKTSTKKFEPQSLKLFDQASYLLQPLNNLRGQELVQVLNAKFKRQSSIDIDQNSAHSRQLHLTNRYFPITGTYHGAFGAFHDEQFRKYDFLIGVYDGLKNITSFVCNEDYVGLISKERLCSAGEESAFWLILNSLFFKDHIRCGEVCEFITALAQAEKSRAPIAENETANHLKAVWSLASALSSNPGIDFDELLHTLNSTNTLNHFGSRLQLMAKRSGNNEWLVDYADQALRRLIEIEATEQGDASRALAVGWQFLPIFDRGVRGKFSGEYAAKPHQLIRLAPDNIGIDGWQSGFYLEWDKGIKALSFQCKKRCRSHHAGVQFSYLFRAAEDVETGAFADTEDYFLLGLNWKVNLNSFAVSSVRFSLDRNFGYQPSWSPRADDTRTGANMAFGLLGDKIQLSFGTRDTFSHTTGFSEWSVRVGLMAIPEWIYGSLFLR